MFNQFLWVIFPYLCLAIFVIGHIARYKFDQFSWTAKSSEFIEKKQLKWGSLLFHLGIIPVFFGHVVGLLIPAHWLESVGVNNHLYHIGAVYIGSIFGIITLIGMFLLTARRVTKQNVRRLSSASDIFVNFLLLTIVFVGCYATLVTNATVPDFDYRQTISIWFRGLFMLSPDASLMVDVPLAFKLHVLLGFSIMACWPFTRLVHVWSVPLTYASRSYIIYRKHKN
ncbi:MULTISPECIES: respiratory nitrate reductase subunit gamma [unclassified Staphylococcus]|uniref:respiratory nitrate reductase subunit gamma n=1 Tax=unclassified Staphylococcus TaxID=91994 RepID=UPI0021CDFCB0|nr:MULTISPECIES: respiratory nitrate reductase subunit gamma [unclassified Staphylococcus]UXR69392.1 respiratory nitrate reductase subunit gamma [Staphylococcus sp. IVB6246]UXR71448.1 respiratory nitrate reductase subunit gamma [Staphylococcus sp. IVB6240]UXR73726.1 respiratory nitrate reductase subunit gamma [Staphylococcus sp. IVB6238]UXR76044.1 respiratory nitrate reductase subunit gamma [Staphylococcus sp. IVB6233]UXR80242.1 respiratory nitrate reductase subunit gamma [Staphylococcus sp. I